MRISILLYITIAVCSFKLQAGFIESEDYINKVSSSMEHQYYIDINELTAELSKSDDLIIKDFPLPGTEHATLVLKKKKNIVDQQTVFLIGGSENTINQKPANINTFTGKIAGIENSDVFLCEVDGYLYAQIISDDGSIITLTPDIESGIPGYHILLNEGETFEDKFDLIKCKSEGEEIPLSKILTDSPLSTKLLEAELAVETDSEFYKATGGTIESAQRYLIALMSIVSHYYELEANVRLKLVWIKTWTDSPSDPYDVKGDAYALPKLVMPYWRDNYQNVQRDLAHVITSISYGGGGYGYFNALCGNAGNWSFSVSSVQARHNMPTFAFTYDAYIVAHELGHNFNARHTHSCYYNGIPIDTCETTEAVNNGCLDSSVIPKPNPGSIMSYCGGRNSAAGLGWQVRMTFLEQVSNVIRASAEASSCITEPAEPLVSLLNPRGNQSYMSEDNITIKWTSSGVDNIGIVYSTDDGSNWKVIAEDISVMEGEYKWQFPDLCSKKVRFMIYDESAKMTADTSLPFTVEYSDKDKLHAYYPFAQSLRDEQFCHYFNLSSSGEKYSEDRGSNQNSSLSLDGSSDIKCDDFDAAFDEITVSWWFNGDEWNTKQTFVGTNWEEGWVFETYFWGQFGVSYYFNDSSVPRQLWGGVLPAKEWLHGAFTYDGRRGKLYLNGSMVSEFDEGAARGMKKFSSTPLYVGSRKDKEYFKGKLDDIKIYKRALNETEIKELAEEPATNIEERTVGNKSLLKYYFTTNNQLHLMFNDEVTGIILYDIFDIRGCKVITGMTTEREKQIDISNLTKAVYFVRIRTGTHVEMLKFVP